MPRRERLNELTRRWEARHGRRSEALREHPSTRPLADSERNARAAAAFPFRAVTPAAYVSEHGDDMIGYTYDDYRYGDPELQAWIDEVGRLLRRRRVDR